MSLRKEKKRQIEKIIFGLVFLILLVNLTSITSAMTKQELRDFLGEQWRNYFQGTSALSLEELIALTRAYDAASDDQEINISNITATTGNVSAIINQTTNNSSTDSSNPTTGNVSAIINQTTNNSSTDSSNPTTNPGLGNHNTGESNNQNNPSVTPSIPLYRLFKEQQSFNLIASFFIGSIPADHFFTTNEAEKEEAIKKGYTLEGVLGYMYNSSQANTKKIYKICKKAPLMFRNKIMGDCIYTSDDEEIREALNNHGYQYEGFVGYIYISEKENTLPLYRLNKLQDYGRVYKFDDHFFTIDRNERDNLVDQGYNSEGIVGFIPKNQ